jgi:hypothetical protein
MQTWFDIYTICTIHTADFTFSIIILSLDMAIKHRRENGVLHIIPTTRDLAHNDYNTGCGGTTLKEVPQWQTRKVTISQKVQCF